MENDDSTLEKAVTVERMLNLPFSVLDSKTLSHSAFTAEDS